MNSCGENSGDNVRRSGSFHRRESIINHRVVHSSRATLMYSKNGGGSTEPVPDVVTTKSPSKKRSPVEYNYPHMRLYVRHFSSTDSTFVVLDTSMLFSVMFEQFGQGEEFEMAIRTFVAPLVAATALQWRGLEAVAQFVPFHSPRF